MTDTNDKQPVASCLICGVMGPLVTWGSGSTFGVCQECRQARGALAEKDAQLKEECELYDERIELMAAELAEKDKELSELNAALAERQQWRAGNDGPCAICGSTIFHTDGLVEDARGKMHPICPFIQRAEKAESALAEKDAQIAQLQAEWTQLRAWLTTAAAVYPTGHFNRACADVLAHLNALRETPAPPQTQETK